MKQLRCDHFGGQWADEDPCEMDACACGLNTTCPICGYGWGTDKCECHSVDPDMPIEQEVLSVQNNV